MLHHIGKLVYSIVDKLKNKSESPKEDGVRQKYVLFTQDEGLARKVLSLAPHQNYQDITLIGRDQIPLYSVENIVHLEDTLQVLQTHQSDCCLLPLSSDKEAYVFRRAGDVVIVIA